MVKEYAGAHFSDRTMMVFFPDTSRIDLKNPSDVTLNFPREKLLPPKSLFAEEFRAAFFESIEKQADYISLAIAPEALPTVPDSQTIGLNKPADLDVPAFHFKLPKREFLQSHGIEFDLGLFVCQIKSARGESKILNPRIGAIQETYLVLEGWYIVWDYRQNQPIAYGRFRPMIGFKRELETKDWMQAFHRAGRQVIERSPFKGTKWLKLAE
jgi:hypothetical protein